MIFKCGNCGGNVVYSPSRGGMYCPYCGAEESGEKREGSSLTICPDCGGELDILEYASASKCPYCGSYLIIDERIEGKYRPALVLPFQLDKEAAVEELRKEFRTRVFTPDSFLTESTLQNMEGVYVPFWLYDYHADYDYAGLGTRVRVWISGDTEYTETSYYRVERGLEIDFDHVPVDASIAMDDGVMDLMEPFDYGQLEDFRPEYMSGFFGEVYNADADALERRAWDKSQRDAESLMQQTLEGYTTMTPERNNLDMKRRAVNYALFPVWKYEYSYRKKKYTYYVNGQTGKVIGVSPVSAGKVVGYGLTAGGLMTAAAAFLILLLEIL